MYKIIFTNRALKDFSKLDFSIKNFVKEKIKEYCSELFIHAKKLKDTKIGTFRFRIGDYRVVFDIDDDKIIILRLGHRKEIYK